MHAILREAPEGIREMLLKKMIEAYREVLGGQNAFAEDAKGDKGLYHRIWKSYVGKLKAAADSGHAERSSLAKFLGECALSAGPEPNVRSVFGDAVDIELFDPWCSDLGLERKKDLNLFKKCKALLSFVMEGKKNFVDLEGILPRLPHSIALDLALGVDFSGPIRAERWETRTGVDGQKYQVDPEAAKLFDKWLASYFTFLEHEKSGAENQVEQPEVNVLADSENNIVDETENENRPSMSSCNGLSGESSLQTGPGQNYRYRCFERPPTVTARDDSLRYSNLTYGRSSFVSMSSEI